MPAQMAGLFPLDGFIALVKYVSMWSMAGITTGRLELACEKYNVASLRICQVDNDQQRLYKRGDMSCIPSMCYLAHWQSPTLPLSAHTVADHSYAQRSFAQLPDTGLQNLAYQMSNSILLSHCEA